MSDNENIEFDGKVEKYIHQLESQIQKRVQLYGYDDLTVQKQNQKLCKILNQQGLIALQKQNNEQCLEYLRKAEYITLYVPQLKVQTYNNLACYYRKIGKTRTALQYLQQALNIELQTEDQTKNSNQLPDIYLNLCAVLSQLERHEEAIQHVYLSIIMLQHELLIQQIEQSNQDCVNNFVSRQSSVQQVNNIKDNKKERISILVVAYHNLGVEMEHLKKEIECKKIFQHALQLSELILPQEHQLKQTLKQILKKYKIDNNNSIEQFTLKPILPKLTQKLQDLKQIYRSVSPRQSISKRNQQLKINSQKTTKSIQKNSFCDDIRQIHSVNMTTEGIIKNKENRDSSNVIIDQTTIF